MGRVPFSSGREWGAATFHGGEFDKEGLATMSAGLQLIGEIDKPVDWNAVIDQRFLPEELRRPL